MRSVPGGHEVMALTRKVSAVAASTAVAVARSPRSERRSRGALASARAEHPLTSLGDAARGLFLVCAGKYRLGGGQPSPRPSLRGRQGARRGRGSVPGEYDVPADGAMRRALDALQADPSYGAAKDAPEAHSPNPHAPLGGLLFFLGPDLSRSWAGRSRVAARPLGHRRACRGGACFRPERALGSGTSWTSAIAGGLRSSRASPTTRVRSTLRADDQWRSATCCACFAGAAGRPDLIGFGLRPEAANDLPDLFADTLPTRGSAGLSTPATIARHPQRSYHPQREMRRPFPSGGKQDAIHN